jgi:Mg-chelatase subunit ChlD
MLRFSNYWALGLLILIPYIFYLSKKSLADLPPWRRWSAFGLRSTMILLLVLALSGFKLVWPVDRLCVIFALDASNSIPEGESTRASGFIREAMGQTRENDEAGVVVFGEEAYVELPPKIEPELREISSVPSKEYTNLESAVSVAMELFPAASQKRVVLMTDGNENAGNVLDEAEVAESSGVEIYTVPLSTVMGGAEEVLVDALIGPGSVELGRTFELRAIVTSTVDGKAKLKLFRDRDYLDEEEVRLSAARKNVFTFSQKLDSEGTYVYELLIEPSADTLRENNVGRALVIASGRPKILYLATDDVHADYLHRVLTQEGMEVESINDPSQMPTSLSEMQNYSAIIFNDVPADSLSLSQMETLETYVHDLGGGFAMIGGENSFGSGGYYKTPIEDILPVKMIPERKKRSLSIVLAIDKSGSMAVPSGGYVKIDLAKEAAVSVVEFLTDKDQIGVIAFDAEAQEIVRPERIGDKGAIEDKIGRIQPRGGTNVYPALEMAYTWLKDADTQLKHVILVSDGRSQQPDASYPLVSQMAQGKITVSTIAIGSDADRKMMKNLADLGGGRYYETSDAGSLPRIFVKEAFVASELIMEGDFRPIASGDSEILKGIDTSSLPPIRGYVGTSAKEGASVTITSDQDDPILASWQYGLGRTLAFTSDAKPRWALEWLKWGDFSKFWSQAVGWTLAIPAGEFAASASVVGSAGSVTVDAVDSNGRFRNFLDFQASVVKPDLSHETVSLKQSGPGRYEAEFDAGQMGTYLLRVSEMKDGKVVESQNTGAVVSYSPEYKDFEPDYSLLKSLAEDTGGKFGPEIGEVIAHGEAKVWQLRDLWRSLVLASIPLFFLDVALRRITISKEQLSELRNRLRLSKGGKMPDTKPNTLLSLKLRKEEMRRGKTQDSRRKTQDSDAAIKVPASPRPRVPASPPPSDEPYTSRLLQAKKRAKEEA